MTPPPATDLRGLLDRYVILISSAYFKSGSVLLRMPAELKDKLAARARQRRRNVNDLIVETLTERLAGKEPMASTNGKARRPDDKVRVAIIGVGNCANSLVQGVEYYKDADPDDFVPGLMHVDLGGYHIRDVVEAAAGALDLFREEPLELARHPDEHVLAGCWC